MNRCILLPAAYLLDQLAGDPECLPHPVRLIGFGIARGETALRRPDQSVAVELASGAALTAAIVFSTYFFTAEIIRQANRRSTHLGDMAELILGWTCLAARNLQQETSAVVEALALDDIPLARRRLSRIVGRDTQHLDDREISRAVIETAAESASDGIMAPLFYMALGGVPLAMAYKAVNTLDSMIGHADSRYFYFGKAAARLDDAANYLPARLTAFGIVAAATVLRDADPGAAMSIWLRDGDKHKSPNAGQPESAMAGALHVRLGGENTYAGEVIPASVMGQEFSAAEVGDSKKAIRMVSVVACLGVGFGILISAVLNAREPR
ncbi:adenosylcobinamide-phosphate synthase [Silvibacterium bohemicum]|uniref:Cobalamin biosynthesis protein CobD n=1 Tax=Silvibacterium bohemicum TaxID=1577686 RepID=A0A841JY70_9BACT|nr:adenosylcobinamide-phosphate synthase CbiB [Silvibacterium bohemicum]MBB6142924.1 adenosylcobinamide-phosphate synthase [Silvibacterium bohemicum]